MVRFCYEFIPNTGQTETFFVPNSSCQKDHINTVFFIFEISYSSVRYSSSSENMAPEKVLKVLIKYIQEIEILILS